MLGTQLTPSQYLKRCAEVFDTLEISQIEGLADDIYKAYEQGRFVFLISPLIVMTGGALKDKSPHSASSFFCVASLPLAGLCFGCGFPFPV